MTVTMDRKLSGRNALPAALGLTTAVCLSSCSALGDAVTDASLPEIGDGWCTVADEREAQERLDHYLSDFTGYHQDDVSCPDSGAVEAGPDGSPRLFMLTAGYITLPAAEGGKVPAEAMDREIGAAVDVMTLGAVHVSGHIGDYLPATPDSFLQALEADYGSG